MLTGIGAETLGTATNLILSILIALACFTTAVGIITGASDFAKFRFKDSQSAYTLTALISCVLGVLMGQFNVGYIILVALPALLLVYPVTIALIILNNLSDTWATARIFRWVIVVTLLMSIPDFMESIGYPSLKLNMAAYVPFQAQHLGWVLPAILAYGLAFWLDRRLAVH